MESSTVESERRTSPGGQRPSGLIRRQKRALPRQTWLGYAFVLPQTVGFAVFAVIPLIAVFYLSFHTWDFLRGDLTYVGATNYERLLNDPNLQPILLTTLFFVAGYVTLNTLFGLLLALAANRALRAAPHLRSLYFSPVVVTLVAWTLVFTFMLQENGFLNESLRVLSVDPPNWLREDGWALVSVIVVQALKTGGVAMVIFLAGLQNIPTDLVEAAQIDGASSPSIFRHITFPLLTPYVFFVIVISIIGSFRSFALIDLMTGGGPGTATTVLSYYVYQQGFQRFDLGYAATVAVLLLGIVLAITALQFGIRKRWVVQESL